MSVQSASGQVDYIVHCTSRYTLYFVLCTLYTVQVAKHGVPQVRPIHGDGNDWSDVEL